MRVLVTGGAGYIGSIVTEELIGSGHEVVVYDNLVEGHRSAVPQGARFVEGDLLQSELLAKTLRDGAIEAVVHMAAFALVGESVEQPRRYYRNNVEAGLCLLNTMIDCGVRRMVFSSSAAVYGEPQKQPIEEDDPTCPTNPYGETKLALERAMHWYSMAYQLCYTSLRYFNAAGASPRSGEDHDPETHLIPLVLQAAAGRREAVDVYGSDYPTPDGTCIRDYIHVVDLARAHLLGPCGRFAEDRCMSRLEARLSGSGNDCPDGLGLDAGSSRRLRRLNAVDESAHKPVPISCVCQDMNPLFRIPSSAFDSGITCSFTIS
jgi:UDP-glucose 4-epimerase